MHIIDLYREAQEPLFSIEVIPPRNGETIEDTIMTTLDALGELDLAFVSVTHHAKNSLKSGTGPIARILGERYGIPALAHLTCTDATIDDIENRLVELRYLGIDNVLALRGDPPMDQSDFIPPPQGHQYASQLVAQIAAMNRGEYLLRPGDARRYQLDEDAAFRPGTPTDFSVAVACYPDRHPENPDPYDDLLRFKEKVEAGADFAITQMFFGVQTYIDFVRRARGVGITVPIIAGVKPVTTYKGLRLLEGARFGIHIPRELKQEMERWQDDKEATRKIGIDYCVQQCKELISAGVPGIHFYTMNKEKDVRDVMGRI